jgi:SAM-dependent methyltransferase
MRTLQTWFESPLGRLLAEREQEVIERHLAQWPGMTLLQVGGLRQERRALRANTARQWLVDAPGRGSVDCVLWPEQLPFQSDTIDIVVLVHSLEFSPNPHRVLREAERVLAPEGHLLILSFNLFSLWGIAHALPALRARGAPWNGAYLSARRIRDWLTLLDMEIASTEYHFFRPPLNRPRLQERLALLERLGPRCLPWFGGVQLTVAKKRVLGFTALRPVRRLERKLVPGGLAQPTARRPMNANLRGNLHRRRLPR